jgi:pyruvate/2-oxoglutarate dehydrogenase complex dihydrolipoamide dehydrogenase (E3) component
VIPAIQGLRELEGIWTNREATAVKELPKRLLILGGGPVGVEMAQALTRMGVSVALVEGEDRVLAHEPKPLGDALGKELEADGIELHFGQLASAVRREGDEFAIAFPDGSELRGDRLLVATGRTPRTGELGLENIGIQPGKHGIEVDGRLSAGEGLWAIGDANGKWPLTYVGKYQARIVASNILGQPREANYDAVPRVVFTDPQAASVGEGEGESTSTVRLAEVTRTQTYTRDYENTPWFMTLVSNGERLIGAYALGPDAGEWLQQATLAIRARVPIEVMRDTIQPYPTFSEVFVNALAALG